MGDSHSHDGPVIDVGEDDDDEGYDADSEYHGAVGEGSFKTHAT